MIVRTLTAPARIGLAGTPRAPAVTTEHIRPHDA